MRKTKLPPLQDGRRVRARPSRWATASGGSGCFSAGCCWGVECHRALGGDVHQSGGERAGRRAAESCRCIRRSFTKPFAEFVIFGIALLADSPAARAAATIIGLYLLLYSTVRFIVEFFRVHEQGNLWGGPLDTSQWISIGLFLLGAYF